MVRQEGEGEREGEGALSRQTSLTKGSISNLALHVMRETKGRREVAS
jgi:hypothetical protein